MSDDRADDRLVRSLAAGDAEALRELVRRHGPALAATLADLTRDRAAAEDLSQEAFLRVCRHASRFVPGGNFRAWLFTIGRHLALNHLRDRALAARRLEPPPSASAPDGGEGAELGRAIAAAIDAIEEPFRTALLLCAIQGLSYEDAAAAAGCSVKTISSRLARARERFARLIAPYLSDGTPVRKP